MNNLDALPKKKILSLFMTCGFPTLSQSKKIFNEMLSHQPDVIEFGLPFSASDQRDCLFSWKNLNSRILPK